MLLDEAVQCLPPDLQALFPAIRVMVPLLEIPETEATEPLDGKTRATATNRFIVDLLQLVLQRSSRRLCIMIDDAQWLDHSSQLLIRQILRKAPAVAWYFNSARVTPQSLAEAVAALLDADECGGASTFGSVLDQLTDEFEQNVRPHKSLIKEIVTSEYRRRRELAS